MGSRGEGLQVGQIINRSAGAGRLCRTPSGAFLVGGPQPMANPQALAAELRRGRVIPFVGSGVSLAVKSDLFPTWPKLLGMLADRLAAESKDESATIVRSYCKKGQFLKAAEEAVLELGLGSSTM